MDVRKRIVKNTLLQLLLNVFNLLIGVYSLSLIARYLGKISFGKYGFVSSYYFFFLGLLDFGLSTISLREISRDRQQAAESGDASMSCGADCAHISHTLNVVCDGFTARSA